MAINQYIYIVPILISLVLLMQLLLNKGKSLKLKPLRSLSQNSGVEKTIAFVENYLAPSKKSAVYGFYQRMLNYTKITVPQFFAFKIAFVALIAVLLFLIHFTNRSIYTYDIFNKYDYQVDEVYQQRGHDIDISKRMEEELYILQLSIDRIPKQEIYKTSKEDLQGKILNLIMESTEDFEAPPLMISNKVYYRLLAYYSVRRINYQNILITLLIVYFMPDLFLKIYNYFILADVKRELRFLKRLIILNGSIKPVNFLEVLSILIEKSKYHRKFLKEIEGQNKKNTISNSSIYRKYIENEKDINVKLFLEKLDQANNYNFDQAIKNIENEFNIEKRQRVRNVKRQIEVINAWGIVGCFLLIGLITMYMLIPWLTVYNLNQMF